MAGLWCVASLASAQPAAGGASFWNEATLYRDEFGTPHIEAGSIRAMASAFGYAQAEDHLEPMLMAYRIALGRAAEVGGEAFAESDAFAIKIGNAEQSAIALGQADPVTRDLCEGFALGINAWILEHQDRVPTWAEGVQPKDVLAWWHYLMVVQAPFDLPGVYHPKAPLERANAWALAPGNTLEGSTLLVMNPHEYYGSPYRWYEAHLMAGSMNLAGATLFGVPVLMMGHNENAGWALTPNLADTADFFLEHIGGPQKPAKDPRFAASVIDDVAPLLSFMSTAKPFYVRTSAGLVERAVPSMIGTRGPIFEGGNGALYSWRNGAFLQFGGLRQLLLMGQATEMAAMKDALGLHQLPGFQVVCADKSGELFYLYNARLGNRDAAASPEDREPMNWSMPVDSGREIFAWREIIAPGLLPQIESPKSGYVQACGTPPWLATAKSGLSAADWPRWLVAELPNYRTFRVNQILSAGKYSFFDMQAMLFDTHVPASADMVPLLLAMAGKRPELIRSAHPDLVTALRLLEGWNLSSDRESPAMAYYSIWWTLMKKRHSAQFGSEIELYQGLLANTPEAQVQALDAAVEAARIMRNDFGGLSIPWGNLHRIQRGNRNEAAPGTDTGDSIFYMDNQSFLNRQWQASFGTGFAMVVQFGEKTQAASIVPFGASEVADSPHFGDQLNLFLERRMKPTNFQYGAVIGRASSGYGTRVLLGTPGLEGHCTVLSAQPQEVKLEAIETPPGPLPAGLVAFTPAFRPVFAAGATAHTWGLELRVPEDICAAESLSRLQIYVHTLEEGWRPLPGHHFDSALGGFVGQGSGSMIIAVLGPIEALKQPESPEVPAPGVAAAPAADFLRAPLPVPVMEGESVPEMVPDGAVASAEGSVEGIGEVGGPVAGDPAAAVPQPAQKPLFDLEFMDQPGVPQPASSLFSGQDPDRSGGTADGGDGEKKEKKRKKKDRAVEEAAGTAPAAPETEQAPRKAKKKVTQDTAPRSRAPKTNFN
jgi:acyl-homoserine-lactone acylase